ncbi:hypothetical protein C3B44_06615 [Corynebacterium yudongzhengii]|uniref:HNH endonuclease n=1 Tax=Corynebacterium yudongzhengii TaxID=2080740 RepID=A0A2U1T9A4_9CORY|nr:HNH endonuclease family protein [Corynebacterium yudongzhengii]AWB82065.1 hypothetical protein C3B44_06615 [Corynebacterium yudongzhengii]PWC02569.1 HNH endonuclease [Corynebacterium yudongzhengii]
MKRTLWSVVALVGVIVVGTLVADETPLGDGAVTPIPATTIAEVEDGGEEEDPGEHYRLLAELEVKGRAPMTGYEREEFGQAWSDDVGVEYGRNGCDTRNDILRRDLKDPVIRDGTFGCLVEEGVLYDPYTAEEIEFARGGGDVEIDHVVALGDAWAKGAQQLDETERRDFANDPLNLQAVGTSVNRQKGAGDAATWLPPNKNYRCTYAQRQIEVKHRYELWVTAAEAEALDRELGRC